MFIYRWNAYCDFTSLPVFDSVSFADAIDLTALPTISFEDIESRWSKENSVAIVFHYDPNVYYFLSAKEYPNTKEVRRMKLEEGSDIADHHCDYYARPILTRFLGRFQRRIHTQQIIQRIKDSMVMDPTTITYHEQFLHQLLQIEVDDFYDRPFLEKIMNESRTIIETEQRYRPDAPGFEEAKQNFEALRQGPLSVHESLA
jgi:hypothetical protein